MKEIHPVILSAGIISLLVLNSITAGGQNLIISSPGKYDKNPSLTGAAYPVEGHKALANRNEIKISQ